jgi:sulfite exporter TauE/SafE
LSDLSNNILPIASLIAGVSGSLHCVGMCGGLVAASCSGGKDVLKYQVGRLAGYFLLGSVAFMLGYALKGVVSFTWGPMISGIFLGLLFIYWGLQSLNGKRVEVPLPKILRKAYQFAYRKHSGSFFVGLISIMLPCGLLYGMIIAALAMGSFEDVMISLLFFWLGTLPAMVGAPQLVKKIMEPLRKKLPVAYAAIFILIGVATIANRLNHFPQANAHTQMNHEKAQHLCH